MTGVTRRVFLSILVFHLIALFAVVIFFIIFQDKGILPEFLWTWIFAKVVVFWVDYFVAITLTSIAFSFSLMLTTNEVRSEIKGEHSFVRIASGSVVLVIAISAAFVVISAFFYGSARQTVEGINSHSSAARNLLESARSQAEKHDYESAVGELNHALIFAPQFAEALRLRDRYVLEMTQRRPAPTSRTDSVPAEPQVEMSLVLEYADQIKKAEEYFQEGDYFSALFFVNKALEKRPRDNPEIAELKSRIENAIRGKTPNPNELEKRKLYEMKQSAIIGSLQNNRPIEAYYQLLEIEAYARELAQKAKLETKKGELSREFQDADVKKWMPVVLKRLQELAFFIDELTDSVRRISNGSILFQNRVSSQIIEFIYAESLIEGKYGYYLLNPEVIVFDSQGRILEHRRSDYGKIIGNNLLLKAIDRQKAGALHEATVLVGNVSAVLINTVKVEASVNNLWDISQGNNGYESMSLPQQIGLLSVLPRLGFDPLPLQMVLMMHIVKALSLGALVFFTMGWAWAGRNRSVSFPVFLSALMVILLPVFMVVLSSLYWAVNQTLVSCLLVLLGFELSIAIIIGLQAILLVLSLVYVSGQTADQ